MEEGKINDQKKNDPKEESIEVREIADEQQPLPEIADEQHAIPSPQLTLEDAEKRLKRQSKAVSSTVQKMIKRAKRGVGSFSKNIIEKKAVKNKKKEDEDEDVMMMKTVINGIMSINAQTMTSMKTTVQATTAVPQTAVTQAKL
ncbi:hypothetical protein H5410_026120 [Solanum commersonii]|uniref:Uncharacterized protein n=1 Tax=Solanum commersonii TaxID=4109 RepID=A0A9J5YZW9_SOLCO|nr:hypothetical protein H5410_026120 [Solanum commersonii]